MTTEHYLKPQWPVPPGIQAWQTTRLGGYSRNGYGEMNLAATVGDDPQHLAKNRAKLKQDLSLPDEPAWIRLVHGNLALDAQDVSGVPDADATYTGQPNRVLLIPTADCLPVLFASRHGNEVAAAHAGWRGLSAGILENTLARFRCPPEDVLAWFGPAISAKNFEVGEEVLAQFAKSHPGSERFFDQGAKPGKYLADIYQLGRYALQRAGLRDCYGGGFCTVEDERFF
ncbi:MAG: peptidoglycan editing factor PgeF, partial [Gammaproteobacteria bacterium]|nr:peptidoglycan editing factor PgeF [Gammaproteobacteria bacterium]